MRVYFGFNSILVKIRHALALKISMMWHALSLCPFLKYVESISYEKGTKITVPDKQI